MLFLIGAIIVFGCVLGCFSEHGNLKTLWQPLEFVIIVGAATGAFIISNPATVLKDCLSSLKYLFKGKPYKKDDYMQLLMFLYEVLKLVKSKGLLQLESHIENPHESEIFKKYPALSNDHHVVDFFCNNFRLITLGLDNQYVMTDALDQEIEVHHHQGTTAAGALSTYGESLPALGIVAAVLGVITTMASITEPPDILGGLIGSALVGTFAGILLSYGIFSPIGSFVGHYVNAQTAFLNCIKVAIISHLQGNAPVITVELARKNIPGHERPSFQEVDTAINKA
jgi:chemotaxis protein MotA